MRCYETAISTHTPHARRDEIVARVTALEAAFQLTRLMRGVTSFICGAWNQERVFQLTRLMRGVTGKTYTKWSVSVGISTHTPHARRDALNALKTADGRRFQLTRLMRGVTALRVII